ncbi:unnamed protein product [Anisakis simplex]|uniref:Uncharacterized protein n=1 Tax=Anisakis simplex TaxID=6269 RepID=A0A0M3J952_ANISI|nr:unnamed protein product [Anisakis simplex]
MPFGSEHKENRLRISSIPQPTMRETHTTTLERNANESTTLQIDDKELTEVAVVLRKLMKSNVTLEQLAKLLGEDIDNSTSHSSQIGAQHSTERIKNDGLKNGATKMFLKSPTSAKHSSQTHYISRAEINESIERSNGINQNQLNNDLGNESKRQQQQNLDKLEHFKPEETSTEIASQNSILTNISESFREDEPSKTSKKAEDAHHENRKENVLLAMDR